ncbi:MAG: hypothetical protein LUG24_01410 [Clostridiales bacterium]|nr:hypothetical protein [Clostridiales bacterium]
MSITIETDGSCIFPAFVLLSEYKSTPLKKGDGDIVCSVAENTEIKGSYTFNFDVAQLRKDTRLKLFFVNDKNYKAFKIACKSGSSI